MIDYEQLAQEDALFPWLASDCMADFYDKEYNYFFNETFTEEE